MGRTYFGSEKKRSLFSFEAIIAVYLLLNIIGVGVVHSAVSTCTDSDGGGVPAKFGYVTGLSDSNQAYKYEDKCEELHGVGVNEWYCSNNNPSQRAFDCQNGCKGGACLSQIEYSCSDPDGLDASTKGTATSKDSLGKTETKIDNCLDANNVNEAACESNGKNSFLPITCTYGCKDGACKSAPTPTCKDSDGGGVPAKFGYVSGTTSDGKQYKYEDKCEELHGVGVNEWYCSNNNPSQRAFDCQNGCKGGACLSQIEYSCSDPDGLDASTKGTATSKDSLGKTETKIDNCLDANNVNEAVCESTGGKNSFIPVTCTYGCKDGACKSAPTQPTQTCPSKAYVTSNKDIYYEGDSLTLKVYAYDKNQIIVPNMTFKLATYLNNSYTGTSNSYSTSYSTDSTGYYTITNTVSDSTTTGTYRFVITTDVSGCTGVNTEKTVTVKPKQQPQPAPTCKDSDGGGVPATFGYVSGTTSDGKQYRYEDKCEEWHGVNEWYCSNSNPSQRTFGCQYGCEGGACLSQIKYSCTDPDGRDASTKGSATFKDSIGKTETKIDYCLNATSVNEAVCESTGGKNSFIPVTCTYGCKDGACKAAPQVTCPFKVYVLSKDIYYEGDSATIMVYANDANSKLIPNMNFLAYVSAQLANGTYVNSTAGPTKSTTDSSGYYTSTGTVSSSTPAGDYTYKVTTDVSGCVPVTASKTFTMKTGNSTISSCTDTDEGQNPTQSGKVYGKDSYGNDYSKQDYCLSSDYVTEYYCYGRTPVDTNPYCKYGCLNGACNSAPTTPACTDSDGGINGNIKGSVSGVLANGRQYTTSDYCYYTNLGVIESYCGSDNNPWSTYLDCDYGCSNGACKSAPSNWDTCKDSGDDFYRKDTATIYKRDGDIYSSEDVCLDDGRVQEQLCLDSEDYPGSKNFGSKYLQCPNGCSNGACIRGTNPPPLPVDTATIATTLSAGWNMIPFIYSDTTASLSVTTNCVFDAGWVYSPLEKKYYPMTVDGGRFKITEDNRFSALYGTLESMKYATAAGGAWAYVQNGCTITANYPSAYEPASATLPVGWNFVRIAPWMAGKSLSQLGNDCNIEKIYSWQPSTQTWQKLYYLDTISSSEIGSVRLAKVSSKVSADSCKLLANGMTRSIGVPSLPE